MADYFLNIFTPQTWQSFNAAGATTAGFRMRYQKQSQKVRTGDFLVCYMTKISRFCGLLCVRSSSFISQSPIHGADDPYQLRFTVDPIVLLEPNLALPIHDEIVWQNLDLTRSHKKGSSNWTTPFRTPFYNLKKDGPIIAKLLIEQKDTMKAYPLTKLEKDKVEPLEIVKTKSGYAVVEIPEEVKQSFKESDQLSHKEEVKKSIEMQAKVALMGIKLGFKIWIPASDKVAVKAQIHPDHHPAIVDDLNLSYDKSTIKTILNIDVIWLNGNAMARAFEIEHSTAIYSGLLRMADLFSLQPNMKIKAHIVADEQRKDKVISEIRRPVFSKLESGPLQDSCTFLPYEAIDEILALEHLQHLKPSIVETYAMHAKNDE